MVISDRIAVLDQGRIMQIAPPAQIYSAPANRFVAGFMGTTSFIHGTVVEAGPGTATVRTPEGGLIRGRGRGLAAGQEADVAVRPESIRLLPAGGGGAADPATNVFPARIVRAAYVGELTDYQLDLRGALLRARGEASRPLPEGSEVRVKLDPEQLWIVAG